MLPASGAPLRIQCRIKIPSAINVIGTGIVLHRRERFACKLQLVPERVGMLAPIRIARQRHPILIGHSIPEASRAKDGVQDDVIHAFAHVVV